MRRRPKNSPITPTSRGMIQRKNVYRDTKADFALAAGLITEAEHKAAYDGDITIENNMLFNKNTKQPVTRVPLGTWKSLYLGRAQKLMVDTALGDESPEID